MRVFIASITLETPLFSSSAALSFPASRSASPSASALMMPAALEHIAPLLIAFGAYADFLFLTVDFLVQNLAAGG